jgi:hypothetical protein
MLTNPTVEKLREMRLSVMADAFTKQLDDNGISRVQAKFITSIRDRILREPSKIHIVIRGSLRACRRRRMVNAQE